MIARKKFLLYSLTPVLACSVLLAPSFASHKKKKDAAASASQTQPAPAAKPSTPAGTPMKAASKPSATPASHASASEIANAKSKGMVWVNTDSKVYHTGGKYYGNTQHGQFMSVADAQKAGYRASKR